MLRLRLWLCRLLVPDTHRVVRIDNVYTSTNGTYFALSENYTG